MAPQKQNSQPTRLSQSMLEIFAQTTISIQPPKTPFHHPPPRYHQEPLLPPLRLPLAAA